MNTGDRNNITLETLATILGWSFLLNVAILLLWFLIFSFAHDWMYGISAKWFVISGHEFDLINYGGIAFLKIINYGLFLCPYLSIKLCLWKMKQDN